MAKQAKNFKDFISAVGEGLGRSMSSKPVPRSVGYISPGDVLVLRYNGSYEVVLVVANKRSSSGIFLSSRNNILLSCFSLSTKSPQIINLVLDNLYKNRKVASYQNIKSNLSVILGVSSYRTFKLNKVSNLQTLRMS